MEVVEGVHMVVRTAVPMAGPTPALQGATGAPIPHQGVEGTETGTRMTGFVFSHRQRLLCDPRMLISLEIFVFHSEMKMLFVTIVLKI